MLKFLSKLFDDGIGYSGINTAKSAISSLVAVVSNKEIGSQVLVKRFMKGIFNTKPSLPRYNSTWDVNTVLNHLATVDIGNRSLRDVSKKLVTLLALTTGQRTQSLCVIDIRNLELTAQDVKIRFGDLLKQSKPGNHLEELFIESFPQNKSLCVVACLHRYLEITAALRVDTCLFISTQKPHKTASTNTVSNWLRECLADSGIDMSIFSPHSTRVASTSAAALKVPIDTILRTAGWKSDCVFRKHYRRPVTNDSSFSKVILSRASPS